MLELLCLSLNFSQTEESTAQCDKPKKKSSIVFFLQLTWVAIHQNNQLPNLQATALSLQLQWQALLDSLHQAVSPIHLYS